LIYVSDYFFGIFKLYLNLNIAMSTSILISKAKNTRVNYETGKDGIVITAKRT
jgi:hypothetical protein